MTMAYSSSAPNTKNTHTPDQTSIAWRVEMCRYCRYVDIVDITHTLVYATGGREFWMLAWVVDMASKVVTPSATRAGTALWSSQKESQDTDTVMEHGM